MLAVLKNLCLLIRQSLQKKFEAVHSFAEKYII